MTKEWSQVLAIIAFLFAAFFIISCSAPPVDRTQEVIKTFETCYKACYPLKTIGYVHYNQACICGFIPENGDNAAKQKHSRPSERYMHRRIE